MIEAVSQDIIVCGHTHHQFDRTVLGKRIINAGSVGLQSAANGACWACLGPDVDLRETEYDYPRTLQDQIPVALVYQWRMTSLNMY